MKQMSLCHLCERAMMHEELDTCIRASLHHNPVCFLPIASVGEIVSARVRKGLIVPIISILTRGQVAGV